MRANKKNELLECIDSLNQINEQLDNLTDNEKKEIFPLCQKMAIEVGTVIEQLNNENCNIISWLEQYCEEIYCIYKDNGEAVINKSQSKIKILLEKIKKGIEEIKPSPYEIVFLPYKAAMWDSLESIYFAANKSKECNVTVMPIPFYNVNPQGDILSVEYEAKLFPDGIPITNCSDYNLEKMKPDVIFIHNPYDEYNYVTRVAEEYFSSELKKHTSHLVYVPYFVTSRNAVHNCYCLLPGVKNAWRIFVQSEEVKKGYQKYTVNKEKVVALGSPKFDKVKKIEDNLKHIPQEWKDYFGKKKIFLLNTHIDYIIGKSELILEKLYLIFDYFKNDNDIALLWRPHPLSMETAKSLSPDFLEKYLRLIDKFKSLSIGIYDESADIHRAITVSDAYIGGISSIVSLYGLTGKPIYIIEAARNNIREKINNLNELENKIIDNMKKKEEGRKYLFYENFVSLEYYVMLIKGGKDICKKERVEQFLQLQYAFNDEKTAGERIWHYIYNQISCKDTVDIVK